MQRKKIMALLMVSLFFTVGCLGALEDEVEIPDIDLPLDWKTIVPRAVSTPDLVEFDDCDDLENRLKDVILEDYRIQLLQAVEEQYYYFWDDIMLEDDMMAEADGSATGGSSPPTTTRRVEGTDFSGTNNQEGGVDEADVVKTDGYYIYFLSGKKLEIMGVPEFGELVYQSNTTIEGNPHSMLLDGDRLVVISSVSSWNIPASNPLYQAMEWDEEYSSWRTYSLTKFSVFDISDRSDIELERELFIEGSYITAREVDGTIRTVTNAWM